MTEPIRLALSTCPNDTFLIHGLRSGKVSARGLRFDLAFHDVQELNDKLRRGGFDLGKVSFAVALGHTQDWSILSVGSALGFGVGPVLLGAAGGGPLPAQPTVLCPGADTTATLLLRALHPEWTNIRQVVFSEIMPALASGQADLGVCIHEGRFTYGEFGLRLVEDLGKTWEERTGGPLPLGGWVAARHLDPALVETVQAVLSDSLQYGLTHREETVATMAEFAQEMEPSVMFQHVDLYVNAETQALDVVGQGAIRALWELAGSGSPPPVFLAAPTA